MAATLWLAATQAFAVIGLTPLRVDVFARPGIPEPFRITVINTTQSPRTVTLRVQQVVVDENGGVQLVEEGEEAPSAGALGADDQDSDMRDVRSLITFDNGNVLNLAPNENRVVNCTVNLPSDARNEYLAMVVADPGPEDMPLIGNTNRRIQVVFRIGASIFIVSGWRQEVRSGNDTEVILRRMKEEYFNVEVSELETIAPKEGEGLQALRVVGKMENRSTTYISPIVRATLRDMTRRRIIEETVLDHGFDMVFRQTARRFRGQFESPLQPGKYQVALEIDWGHEFQRTRKELTFELDHPLAGSRPAQQGILQLSTSRALISVRPGQTSRGSVTVRNLYNEPLRITPEFLEQTGLGGWFTFSPSTVVLPPKAQRDIRVTVKADKESAQMTEKVIVGFTPTTMSGESFGDSETPIVEATIRVMPPRSVQGDGAQGRATPPR